MENARPLPLTAPSDAPDTPSDRGVAAEDWFGVIRLGPPEEGVTLPSQ